jgi:hypothetical protein
MVTTDFTDGTDQEQRQISGGVRSAIPPRDGCKAMGRIQSNHHQLFYQWKSV